jgi:hypothetical protein
MYRDKKHGVFPSDAHPALPSAFACIIVSYFFLTIRVFLTGFDELRIGSGLPGRGGMDAPAG